MDPHRYPIKTFDPLLRDLVAWGLVTRSEKPRVSWRLTEAAEHRLNELVRTAGPVDAERLIYFQRCALCNEHGPTRLRQGDYLCDSCFERQVAETHPDAEVAPEAVSGRRHLGRLRNRDKGSLAN